MIVLQIIAYVIGAVAFLGLIWEAIEVTRVISHITNNK